MPGPKLKAVAAALVLIVAHSAQAVTDAELRELREQLRQMKAEYESRIEALERRLAKAEGAATPVAPRAASASLNPDVSLILNGTLGRLQRNPSDYQITGFLGRGATTPGDRGPSVAESELALSASVDPYFRGTLLASLAPDGGAAVEEAYLQTLALPAGLGLKFGRFFSGLGYQNELHPHAWDFTDAPLVYRAFWGNNHGDDGAQLKWVAPTDTLIEIGAEIGRGKNLPDSGTRRDKNGSGAGVVFAHIGGDAGEDHSWRAGVSFMRSSNKDVAAGWESNALDPAGNAVVNRFVGDARISGVDFVWKWAPNRNPSETSFKFQAEWFARTQEGTLTYDTTNVSGKGPVGSAFARRQSGWYAQGVYQFMPRWRAGMRFDQLSNGSWNIGAANAGNVAATGYRPDRASVMIDYSPSEFSRLRLQVARDRSRELFADNQLFLQYIMSLGAHGAHRF